MNDQKPNTIHLKDSYQKIRELLARRIVGMDDVIELLVAGIFCGGHSLLVGVPGLAKTRLVSSLAELLDLKFSRIQFTPDLMPSDVTGAEIIVEDKETGERQFKFLQGPLFANVVLADEINRTPPKTQASLMEAMEENQVSSLGQQFQLEPPFFVLATQNPIEQEGTYPLPAAQLDRFFFEILVDYPSQDEEASIIRMTTSQNERELESVLNHEQVMGIMAAVHKMPVPSTISEYATKLTRLTRPSDPEAPSVIKKYVAYGVGPRAAQALVMGAKVLSMMRGDNRPTHADVRKLIHPVFRHRIVVNFLATADNATAEDVLDQLIKAVPAPDRVNVSTKKKGFFANLLAKNS